MKIRQAFAAAAVLSTLALSVFSNSSKIEEHETNAASSDTAVSQAAIRELRSQGQAGLDELFATHAATIAEFMRTSEKTESWLRVANAIDSVAMQKDAYASRLYWHTDLEAAKRVARSHNKPILSLRLLGNLNEEFSCANSRLFRALLYANNDLSNYLRENYVVHWKSVRPAPRITIDFGDGRKIERTVTGNSIHYVLDENGAIIDALPGLYAPNAFLGNLVAANAAANSARDLKPVERQKSYLRYRRTGFVRINSARNQAIANSKVALSEPERAATAIGAAALATAKMVVTDEVSLLRVYDDFARFEPQINFAEWKLLSAKYWPNVGLDSNSISFIRRQNAATGRSESEVASMMKKLEEFISLDTTRNDFLFRTKLYDWLSSVGMVDLESFNTRVYAEIFKTPNSDKWLGLYSTDVYAALDGNGVVQ